MEGHDFYRVLQVDPSASAEIVAEAYWALVRKAQSLRRQEASDNGRLNRLNVAYATLINADLRASYDQTLSTDRTDGRSGGSSRIRDGETRPSLFARLFRSRGPARSHTTDSCYKTLQVDPEAAPEVIASAYACLRRQLGEDLWHGVGDEEAAEKLARAFSILTDPETRADYDARLFGRREEKVAPERSPAAAEGPAAQPEKEPEPDASPVEEITEIEFPGEVSARTRPLKGLVVAIGRGTVLAWRSALYVALRVGRGLRWFGRSVMVPTGRWLRSSVIVPAWRHLSDRLSSQPSPAQAATLSADLDSAVAERLSPIGTVPLPLATELAPPPTERDQERAPLASLVIQDGTDAGAAFILTDRPISLGADSQCDVILETLADEIAPVHVRIWHRERRFMIHRIANNGIVLVNGRPITWGVLEDGDELRIGQHRMTFALPQEGSRNPNGSTQKAKGEVL